MSYARGLFNKYDNWIEIASYFDSALQEELDFEIKKEDIIRWHDFLKKYLINHGSNNAYTKLAQEYSFFSDEIILELNKVFDELGNNDLAKNFANDFHKELKEALS